MIEIMLFCVVACYWLGRPLPKSLLDPLQDLLQD